MKWETWHGELEQLLHTVQLRTRMSYHCNLAYMQLFGLKNFLTNSRFLYSSSSGRVERRALVARKAATAGLGSKLAVPAEFKAMQSLSFTVSLSMLARRSLFSSVWQDITRSVIMLWGHVTRNVIFRFVTQVIELEASEWSGATYCLVPTRSQTAQIRVLRIQNGWAIWLHSSRPMRSFLAFL